MSQQTVLVTGAAGDIGRAIALRLRRDGFRVVGSDLRECPHDFAGADWISANLLLSSDIERIADSVHGELRGFVHSAGIILSQSLDEIDHRGWDESHAVNVKAAFFLSRRLARRFTRNASIVMVGSIAGQRASPENLVYASTKAALRSVAASLSVAWAPNGVRVNIVAPGLIATETSNASTDELSRLRSIPRDEVWKARVSGIPQSRAGSVEEVANAVSWLISDDSSYVTGATIAVNGGLLAGSS